MRRLRVLFCGVALTGFTALSPEDTAHADTGFSAYGSSSGLGAGAATGIPFGPSQRSRRPPVVPRELPAAPPTAIPAAAPPADPIFDSSLLGGRPLVEPLALGSEGTQTSADSSGNATPQAPPAGPVFPSTVAPTRTNPPSLPPPASSPAPGYGSPSLGYGPATSYSPPPSFTPDSLRTPPAPSEGAPAASAPIWAPQPPATGPSASTAPGMHARPAPPQLPPERNERIPTWDDLPEGPDRRFYLASILGADFGTLSAGDGPNATDQLFTTGAAVGMSFERPQGWIRTEFEGRYRDPLALTVRDAELGGSATVTARDGWSTMVNAWRDFEVTDRVAVYLGGGIGGGGYTVAFDGGFPDLDVGLSGTTAVTGFAWQAGTGASWLVTDRIALDLGYRWYAVDGGPATIDVTTPIGSFSDSVGTTYGASELLFTIRIFEPFRRWGD